MHIPIVFISLLLCVQSNELIARGCRAVEWTPVPRSRSGGWLTDSEYEEYWRRLNYIRRDGWSYSLTHKGHHFYDMIEHTAACKKTIDRYPLGGGDVDGGKHVCDFDELKAPCIIYSFGSGGDYLFEEAMLPTGCQIFTFDCTGDFGNKAPPGVTFKKWCVGGVDEDPTYTITTIMKRLGHSRVDYLKMDVEGAEYAALPNLLELPKDRRPKQLGFELHAFQFWSLRTHATIRATLDLLNEVHRMGYRLVMREDNIRADCCTELLYILV